MLALSRSFTSRNFQTSLNFINTCGAICEACGHHADFHLTSYRQVSVQIYTHKIGGVCEVDFELAQALDRVEVEYSPKWKADNHEVIAKMEALRGEEAGTDGRSDGN